MKAHTPKYVPQFTQDELADVVEYLFDHKIDFIKAVRASARRHPETTGPYGLKLAKDAVDAMVRAYETYLDECVSTDLQAATDLTHRLSYSEVMELAKVVKARLGESYALI
jgi:hypothetical protein